MTTTIGQIFGITVTSTYIYMAFISRTMNEKRYQFRIILAGVCLLFGLILDYLKIFEKPYGFFALCGFAPFIYLLYYEILRRLMKHWIGKYPYAPYQDKVGSKVIGKGYPQNRHVITSDYIFGYTMFFMPFLTMIILLTFIDK
jgi:hypothetical protein